MLSSAALFPSLEPANSGDAAAHAGVVLLVEDEDSLADLITALLRRMRIRVIRASDGAQALQMFRQHRVEIALAVVDCQLPDCGGADVCNDLRAVSPRLPLLLTSGRDQRALEAHFAAGGPCQFLPKPYMPADVTSRVSSLLAGPG